MAEDQREAMLRDFFVRGIRLDIQMAYWFQSPQTFQEAFNIARQFEANRLLLHSAAPVPASSKQIMTTMPKLLYQNQDQSPRLQRPQTSQVD